MTAVEAEPVMLALAAQAAPTADVRLGVLPSLPFGDGHFDAVVGNFVLKHEGRRPGAALREMRRVTSPGGRIVVTIWAVPAAAGQALLGRAVQAAGVSRPAGLPALAPADDFPRTEAGFAALLGDAGLREVCCETLYWEHRSTFDEWWGGPAAGVATIGRIVTAQPPAVRDEIRGHFEALSAEFADAEGALTLPHRALMASGRA